MTTRTPPPTYSEAIMWYMKSSLHQNSRFQNHHSHTNLAHYNSDLVTIKSSQFAHSSPQLMTSFDTYSRGEIHSKACNQNLTVPSSNLNLSIIDNNLTSANTPAIIIHSAVSIPGGVENQSQFEKSHSKYNDVPTSKHKENSDDKSERKSSLNSHHFQKENDKSEKDNCHQEIVEPLREEGREVDWTYENIESTHSSILHNSNSQHGNANSYSECRTASESMVDTTKNIKIDRVCTDSEAMTSKNSISVLNDGQTQSRFHSHDSLIGQNYSQNLSKSNEKSNSMDEAWCESSATIRLRSDNFSTSQGNVRQRSGTLDEATLLSNLALRNGRGRRYYQHIRTSPPNKISKSHNDLSGRHHVATLRDNHCSRSVFKCAHNHYPNVRGDCRHTITPNKRKQQNVSNNHVHHTGEDARINKNHLLPDTRCFQGARSVRSASVDDMHLRSSHDEYIWKDGKVQLKNGGISHAESVRYVWKDGHVEKITSDANNEDTQIEILETPDGKACSKMNPVFVCVLLLAVIALVVILPVYFTS